MHEVGLVADAIAHAERVARESSAARIERVSFELRVGGHISREAVETIFQAISVGTMAEGAVLAIEERPARGGCCTNCLVHIEDVEWVADLADGTCPSCGAPLGPDGCGSELILMSIDVSD